jgi:hypothetical protein
MKEQELSNFLRKPGKREIPIVERVQFHAGDTDPETKHGTGILENLLYDSCP